MRSAQEGQPVKNQRCMKVISWISFFASFIVGIVFETQIGRNNSGLGILVFLMSAVCAFMAVVVAMVFLDRLVTSLKSREEIVK